MKLLLLVLTLALLDADIAAAEVSDKIPSIGFIWVEGFALATAIVLLSRIRRWVGLLLLPVTGILLWGTKEMLGDPFLGPAILQEQGPWYARSAYGACLLMVLSHVVGWRLGNRRRSTAVPSVTGRGHS